MMSSTSEMEPDTCDCCQDKDNAPYYAYNGYVFSKLMPKNSLENLQKWSSRKNDVLFLSYPGSGKFRIYLLFI